ncbi:MAG: transcription antitermination factor NusB [Clostridia bacterium]|nr:transcription antitermination factor NusB [Clostridia bacterium]
MSRITARTAAMQLIYEKLSGGQGGEDSLRMVYDELREDGVPGVSSVGRNEPNEADRSYITRVLEGVLDKRYAIDEKIASAAQGWTIERMPMIDLTIMRLAVWEMMFDPEVPGNVSISEALELTERYSDPEDKKFVNGVLGTILRDLEAET